MELPLPPSEVPVEPSISSSTEPSHSPRKLEIRSVLKSQAVSDAELEMRPKLVPRHSRTRSMQVGTPHDQGMRNMEMMTSLLRDSSEKDNMATQIKQLKLDNARLRDELAKNEESAKTDIAAREAASKESQAEYKQSIEHLKTSYQTILTDLESTHASELEKVRSELDKQQRQSSKLETVATKIDAVEKALKESKARASQNEEEMQEEMKKKVEDRDKLAVIVEDLRAEINRCQKQLDADAKKLAAEKAETVRETEKLSADANRLAAEKAESVREVEKLSADLLRAQQQAHANEDISHDLRAELEMLEKVQDKERRNHKKIQDDQEARFESEKQELEARIEDLKLEVKLSLDNFDSATTQIEEMNERRKVREEEADDRFDQESRRKDVTINGLRETLERNEKRIGHLELERESARKSALEQEIQIKNLQYSLEEKDDRIKELKNASEIEDIRLELGAVREILEKREERIADLESTIQSAQESVRVKDDQIKDLENSLKEKDGQVERLEESLRSTGEVNTRAEASHANEVKNLRGELEKREERIADLELAAQSAQESVRAAAEENTLSNPTTPPLGDDSTGLGHVFVNHDDEAEMDTTVHMAGKAETPLAYHSDDDAARLSPTPMYPRGGKRAGAYVEASKVSTAPRQLSPKSGPATPQMSLEGTLESLLVQTEQLLEVNEDFLIENRRWSRRISGLRSQRGTPRRTSRRAGESMTSPEVRAAS